MRKPMTHICPCCGYNPIINAINQGLNTDYKLAKRFDLERTTIVRETQNLIKRKKLKIRREGKQKYYYI